MMRGDFSNLSERKLMDCLTRLGYDVPTDPKLTTRPIAHLPVSVEWRWWLIADRHNLRKLIKFEAVVALQFLPLPNTSNELR